MSLVIIGASPNVARVAHELDVPLVHALTPGTPVEPLLRLGDRAYPVEYADPHQWDRFVAEVLGPLRPSAVVSVTERGLLPAAVASLRLGKPGTPPNVVRRLVDKREMRRRLASCAPHLTAWSGGPDSQDIPTPTKARPLVAKPRRGTASQSVRLVTSVEELAVVHAGSPEDVVLEQFVPGREYSVESFSRAGRHRALAITEKLVGEGFIELGHVVPPVDLSPAESDMLVTATQDFLTAVGLEDGPAHTEFKLHDDGVTVIESHNRPGGDRIPDLVHRTTGFDLRRWSLAWTLGRWPEPPFSGDARAAAVAFATSPAGVVESVSAPEDMVHDVQLYVAAGDHVGELRTSRDRVGSALVTGDESRACLAEAMAVASQLRPVLRTAVGGAR